MTSCTQCQGPFTHTPEDQKFYALFQVPQPKTCPNCRMHRRMMERNVKSLYYRKCDLTGEQIISQYDSNVPFPVYQTSAWWGDSWDGTAYGVDFDFTRPFFEQFKAIQDKTPRVSLWIIPTLENSDFTNCTGYLKNCYLIMESDYDEDCYYSNLLKKCKDLCDCSVCYECELCYECIDCQNCSDLKYSQDCKSCQSSYFLKSCQSCTDCIGCINQRHKQYMIFNQQYSREEYEQIKRSLALNTRTGIKSTAEKAQTFFLQHPHKNLSIEKIENSIGDHLYNAKDSYFCFDCKDIEDSRYCTKLSLQVKSCMDYSSWGDKAELVYQSSSSGDGAYNIKFCTTCSTNVRDLEYCDLCTSSSDLFGCVGLKKKQYCILNKQYTKEAYLELKAKIIAHMKMTGEYGEYFPADLCPFAHNETMAQDFFPLTRAEALAQGYRWHDEDMTNRYQGAQIVLPETSEHLPDDLVKQILSCSGCGKNYRFTTQELKFYQLLGVPPPQHCFDCRHKRRINARNPFQIWQRDCGLCHQKMATSFAPNKPEIVYCEACYQKTVY